MNIDHIRQDFPIFQQQHNGKPIIYFDSACQSLRPQVVIDAIDSYYLRSSACMGRSMHYLAAEVTRLCDESRKTVAKFLNASKKMRLFSHATPPRGSILSPTLNNLKKGM